MLTRFYQDENAKKMNYYVQLTNIPKKAKKYYAKKIILLIIFILVRRHGFLTTIIVAKSNIKIIILYLMNFIHVIK